ncbi:hypothetical protein SAMN04490202_1871 [Pseudomonas reinekei]|jgi:hypothetical protein|uniref:Uncharacterized protein n=1 Tax=Pseudomonas reinekei TaxID=395598 RepID=A0A1H0MEV9_PSERE|nr:hypothetical protein SAMN04490202_1871 [Pseudomonas reinekei]
MNTASIHTMFTTTARAVQGHNGNNWITAATDC